MEIYSLIAPEVSVIFRSLIRLGRFPVCWRTVNVTPIPKGSSATVHLKDYRPFSLTLIISKLFERIIAKRLLKFFEISKI